MFDPNAQSVHFYLDELERSAKDQHHAPRQNRDNSGGILRVISVIGVVVMAAFFLPTV